MVFTEIEGNEGHYALLIGIEDDEVILCDPDGDHGPVFRMNKDVFFTRFKDDLYTHTVGWAAFVRTAQ